MFRKWHVMMPRLSRCPGVEPNDSSDDSTRRVSWGVFILTEYRLGKVG